VKDPEARLFDEFSASLGEFDHLMVPVEQSKANSIFEFLDPLADRRLIDPQAFSCS
jgi:hypothetical protein